MTILRTTSAVFPASRQLMGDIPYVLRIEFGELAKTVEKIVGKPIACQKCNGLLVSVDQIKTDPNVGRHFICSFCGTLNLVPNEVTVVGTDADFVLVPPPPIEKTPSISPTASGGSFLAVIDVSGSMAGVNLAAVKRSLITSVESLAANAPNTLFGLIEFESSVAIHDLENGQRIMVPPESFPKFEDIVKSTERLLDRVKLVNVRENAKSIKQCVQQLVHKGGTALGPAITAAYVIAKHRQIQRVVLLTDGLANEGVGALEGYQVTPASQYYEELGRMFRDAGTIVDIVGIAGGSGMELKTLGLLCDATGGQMYYVTPNELDQSMAELAGASVLGRDVEVRVITPPGIRLKDVSGVSQSIAEEFTAKGGGRVGSVIDGHEIYIEVEPEHEITAKEVPIQVQVAYTDENGARRVRTATRTLKVAKKENEILETLDPTLSATFVTQKAGGASFRGDHESGRRRIEALRAAIRGKVAAAPQAVQTRLQKAETVLANQQAEIENREQTMRQTLGGAPSPAADEVSTESLKQSRKKARDLFD